MMNHTASLRHSFGKTGTEHLLSMCRKRHLFRGSIRHTSPVRKMTETACQMRKARVVVGHLMVFAKEALHVTRVCSHHHFNQREEKYDWSPCFARISEPNLKGKIGPEMVTVAFGTGCKEMNARSSRDGDRWSKLFELPESTTITVTW